MPCSLLEREEDTLQQHFIEPHRHELFLGAGAQRDPVSRDLDADSAERSAGASDRCRSLRRAPQRIATARHVDRKHATVGERAQRRRRIRGRDDRDLAVTHQQLCALLFRLARANERACLEHQDRIRHFDRSLRATLDRLGRFNRRTHLYRRCDWSRCGASGHSARRDWRRCDRCRWFDCGRRYRFNRSRVLARRCLGRDRFDRLRNRRLRLCDRRRRNRQRRIVRRFARVSSQHEVTKRRDGHREHRNDGCLSPDHAAASFWRRHEAEE